MNKLIPICLLLLILSCKTTTKSELNSITSTEVKEAVSFLATDDLNGRHTGSEGIDKAATYIETQFKAFGVKTYFDSYRDYFKVMDSVEAYNVVGYVEGSDKKLKDEFVIIGAHYDHIGSGTAARKKSSKGSITKVDSIANGANDNASGTAAVLALSKYFAKSNSNKRSVLFVLFSAEELGLLGSKHLSKTLKDNNVNLYTLVNFEMIGVPLLNKDYQVFLSGYDLSNMAQKLNEYSNSELIGFSEVSKRNNLFKRSDNFPFYELFKVPCHSMSSCDLTNFDYYHHADDEVSEIDFEFMAQFINQAIPAIEKMTNTPTKEIKMNESK